MADTKITALTAITTVDPAADVLPIVDVSDTSMAASGTTKKITSNQILGAGGTATLASATITGDLTVDTNTLKVDSANNRVGINTASPIDALHVVGSARLGSTNFIGIGADASGSYVESTVGTHVLRFNTTGSERYRLDSTGVATWSNVGGVAGTAMTLNSTGLIRGASSADIISSESTTLTNIGNIGAAYAATTGTYFVAKVGAANGIVELKADARSGAYPPMVFTTGATERLRIDSSGNVGIGVTPAGTGGCLQLKSGITFPATQVASSDANTLDDYEEGNWTATLKGSVSDPTTPVTATGRYTKIGRQVSIQLFVNNVTTTGASGRIQIDGLPFANNGSVEAISNVGFYNMATFTGVPFGLTSASSTVVDMWSSVSAGVFQAVNYNPGSVQYVWLNLTYTV